MTLSMAQSLRWLIAFISSADDIDSFISFRQYAYLSRLRCTKAVSAKAPNSA